MATGEDVLKYLLSKLESEDGWSCANLAWNEDRLTVIADRFSSFEGSVKSKLLLSFLAMSPRVISTCRDEMLKLLRLARRDSDEWVRLFASVLAPFPDSQTITLETDSNASEILEEIERDLSKSSNLTGTLVPHEYRYLNKSILNKVMGNNGTTSGDQSDQRVSHGHFKLAKNPRATSQLRADILQRAETDFSATSNLSKDKSIHRQSSTTSSSSFVSSQRAASAPKTSSVPVPLMQRRYREKGTKLLEIDEVPLAGRRKRKASEIDVPSNKKMAASVKQQPTTPVTPSPTPDTPQETTPLVTPTPDYAAALGTDDTSIQPHTPSLYNSNFTNFPSLNSPMTPNPPSFTPTPTTSTHPLSTRTHPLTTKPSKSTGNQTKSTSARVTISNPEYLNKMVFTTTTGTSTVTATTSTSQSTTINPVAAAALRQQLSSLSSSILSSMVTGTAGAGTSGNSSTSDRQKLLQTQQRILMERQKLLQQLQQQNLMQASQQLRQQTSVPATTTTTTTTTGPVSPPAAQLPQASATGSGEGGEGTGNKQPSKGLKLSRQQLSVAQEIFREAPHLNKQQKALILAFMAGSRENPLPGHNVISIKLNQRQQQELVQSSDGEKRMRSVQLETVFEMNYGTGQWRKLQVKRPLE